MIFVTVGTHEQPFDRLIKKIDQLKNENSIDDEVFVQLGYSNYHPSSCDWKDFLSYGEMSSHMNNADIVISHGGPSTFMKSLSLGKHTIVVPRLEKFGEHVNNHQLTFAKEVKNKGYNIDIVEDINNLGKQIIKLKKDDQLQAFKSHNEEFSNNFIKLVDKLMEYK